MLQKTAKIWRNGEFVGWDEAQIHVLSHVVNYGTSVFEGLRCYELPSGRPSSAPRNIFSAYWTPPRSTAWNRRSRASNWYRP